MVSTAKYFLPKLLARFREEHPGVEIRLAVGNREQLVALLHAGEVDIAIMGRPPKELATRAEPFAAHPHVFVAPPGHALVHAGTVLPGQLGDQPFLMRESGSGTRAALEQFLEAQHVTVNTAMEMSSNETIKQAVMAGMGLSFLSLHTIGLEQRHGLIAVLDVRGAPVVRAWNCVHTLSKLLSPAAEAFRYFMLERGERFLAAEFSPVPENAAP